MSSSASPHDAVCDVFSGDIPDTGPSQAPVRLRLSQSMSGAVTDPPLASRDVSRSSTVIPRQRLARRIFSATLPPKTTTRTAMKRTAPHMHQSCRTRAPGSGDIYEHWPCRGSTPEWPERVSILSPSSGSSPRPRDAWPLGHGSAASPPLPRRTSDEYGAHESYANPLPSTTAPLRERDESHYHRDRNRHSPTVQAPIRHQVLHHDRHSALQALAATAERL
jgi:hypothetical protein